MMICTADGFLKQVCKFAAASQLPIGYLKKKGSFSISCSCALLKSFWYSDPHPLFLSSFHICVWGGCDPLFPAVENAWKSWGRDGDPATARVKWVMGRERESKTQYWVRSCAVISSFELFPNLIHSQTASPKPTAVMHFQQIPQGLDEVWRHSFALTH